MEIVSLFVWRKEKAKINSFFKYLKKENIIIKDEMNNMHDFNPLLEIAPSFFWVLYKFPRNEVPFLLFCNCRSFNKMYGNLDDDFKTDLMSELEFKEWKKILSRSSLIRKKINKVIGTFTSTNEIIYI
jgi:hypothetical protein